MKPIKYTKLKKGNIKYHYTFTQLREFLTHGFKEGNNGWILVGQEGNFLNWKGFGTIENPIKHLHSISVENDPLYDGKMPDPKKVITPNKTKDKHVSYRMVILDTQNN